MFAASGTGKTHMLAEAAVLAVHQGPAHAVLLCAPSESAADALTRQVAARLAEMRAVCGMSELSWMSAGPDDSAGAGPKVAAEGAAGA